MPQPADVERLHARLRAAYAQAWADLLAQQKRIEREYPRLLRQAERLARLRQLERSVQRVAAMLDRQMTVYAQSDFPKAYAMGTIVVDSGFVWTSEHLAAVSQLAADLHTDLLHATRYMRRAAKQTIRALVPDRAVATLLAGSTAQEQARIAAELFADHGLTGVVYRDGSRRSLADYADMVLRTKTAHAYNGGTVNYGTQQGVEVFEVFDGPSCFAADTRLAAYDGLVGLVRARYIGDAVTLRTAAHPDGLTVGPHHPVLTRRGWRVADLLDEGDEILHDGRSQRTAIFAEPDFVQMPSAEHIFATLQRAGVCTRLRPATRHDLHGDGGFAQREVEIVGPVRPLLFKRNPGGDQHPREGVLVSTDADLPLVAGLRGRLRRFVRSARPSRRVMCARDLLSPLRRRVAGPLADDRAASRAEPQDSAGARDLRRRSAACLASERDVTWHRLTSVEHHAFDGLMYDATSVSGLLLANGYVISNCGWLSHDDAVLANGLIMTGDAALSNPSSHPRCQRSFGARPDLHRGHAGSRDSTQTPAQAADSASAELARQAAQDRRRALSAARVGRAAPPSYVARTRALRASRAQRSRAAR